MSIKLTDASARINRSGLPLNYIQNKGTGEDRNAKFQTYIMLYSDLYIVTNNYMNLVEWNN